MKIFELLLSLLAPEDCLVCGSEGSLLCDECFYVHSTSAREECYVCHRHSPGSLTCSICLRTSSLHAVRVGALYAEAPKELVHAAKYAPSRSAGRRMGALVASRVPFFDSRDTVVTYAPTTSGRVRQRAFDQAAEMARGLAHSKNLRYRPLLNRVSPYHQVGSGSNDRLKHMKNGFLAIKPSLVKGKDIVLVDDVMTTGATLDAAARALKKAGARRVYGVVFARAL